MTNTERMIEIIKLIFDKTEVSTELLSSVMLAFSNGAMISDEMSNAEVGEAISQNWIETTKQSMIAAVKVHNRRTAQVAADEQTMTQIAELVQ